MLVECGVYMVEKRSLEDVLADLKAAEKEFNEKCLKYGITEKRKKKKDGEDEPIDGENITSNDENQEGEEVIELTEKTEEISEN